MSEKQWERLKANSKKMCGFVAKKKIIEKQEQPGENIEYIAKAFLFVFLSKWNTQESRTANWST